MCFDIFKDNINDNIVINICNINTINNIIIRSIKLSKILEHNIIIMNKIIQLIKDMIFNNLHTFLICSNFFKKTNIKYKIINIKPLRYKIITILGLIPKNINIIPSDIK